MVYSYNPIDLATENSGTGEDLRDGGQKINSMLEELMTSVGRGLVTTQSTLKVYASPTESQGIPSFRSLINADLPNSGITAGTYGGSGSLVSVVVNSKGVITSATTTELGFEEGYRSDANISYVDSSTVRLGAGFKCRDIGNTQDIRVTSDIDVSLLVSGAGGLDGGAETNSTWYYMYVIATTSGTVSAVLSIVDESTSGTIALPSGYEKKRQLPIAIRNGRCNGRLVASTGYYYTPSFAADIVPFVYIPSQSKVIYTRVFRESYDVNTQSSFDNSDTCLGAAAYDYVGSYITKLSTSEFVPPISDLCDLDGGYHTGGTPSGSIWTKDALGNTVYRISNYGYDVTRQNVYMPTKVWYFYRQTSVAQYLIGQVLGYTITKYIP